MRQMLLSTSPTTSFPAQSFLLCCHLHISVYIIPTVGRYNQYTLTYKIEYGQHSAAFEVKNSSSEDK